MAKNMIKITSTIGALAIFVNMFIVKTNGENLSRGLKTAEDVDYSQSYSLQRETLAVVIQDDFTILDIADSLSYEDALCAQIKEYAKFFKIDPILAEEIAKYYTNSFHNEEYLRTFNIGPTIIGGEQRSYPNAEAGVIAFVRCLYQKPSLFLDAFREMNMESFYCTQLSVEQRNALLPIYMGESDDFVRELITTPDDMWLYEESELTQKQFMAYVAGVFETDPYIAAAINYAEMGELRKDEGVPRKNNYGNYRSSGEFYTYPSKEAGIIDHVIRIMMKQGDLSVVDFVTTKSGAYVHGPNSGIKHEPVWEKNVLGSYQTIMKSEQEAYTVPEGYQVVNHKEDNINRLTLS